MERYYTRYMGCLAVAVVLAGSSVLSACAQGKQDGMHQRAAKSPTSQPNAKMDLSDANIVSLVAIANQSDIEGGQLAEAKANSREVRSYGTPHDFGSCLHASARQSAVETIDAESSPASDRSANAERA